MRSVSESNNMTIIDLFPTLELCGTRRGQDTSRPFLWEIPRDKLMNAIPVKANAHFQYGEGVSRDYKRSSGMTDCQSSWLTSTKNSFETYQKETSEEMVS